MTDDPNPRPAKRARLSTSSSPPPEPPPRLAPLPPSVLLVSLPSLLVHPPNHRFHIHSLCLSLLSLRKCLTLVLNPDVECRAWAAFAEIGMKVVDAGFHLSSEHLWAKGVDIEVSCFRAHSRVFYRTWCENDAKSRSHLGVAALLGTVLA
jgi:hypothetical protein